jgi:hypothetical protein
VSEGHGESGKRQLRARWMISLERRTVRKGVVSAQMRESREGGRPGMEVGEERKEEEWR